jgi:dihydroflavonol-4-reductase
MAKVAVTGATGFIGSAVVRRLLAQRREVRALVEPGADRQNLESLGRSVEQVEVDVCDSAGMLRALSGCSALYHLAAVYKTWTPDPHHLYRVNIEGTTNALLAAERAKVSRVVFTSSIAAVGLRADGQPSDETVAFNLYELANEYILSKHLSERIALRFAAAGLPVIVVNPAFPFGTGDIAPTPTGSIILSLLRGQVPGYGAGGFCAVDVEDVAAGHLLAEEKGRVGERYILGGHNITWRDFFALVCEVAGRKAPQYYVPNSIARGIAKSAELWAGYVSKREPIATEKSILYTQKNAFFDNRKSLRELEVPVTPLRTSIERAVRFFRNHNMI